MKPLLLFLLLASWFYRGQSPLERGQSPSEWGQSLEKSKKWPENLPVFGEIDMRGMVLVRRDGDSAMVGFIDPAPPASVLNRAAAAFAAAGWEVAPIGTSDMLLLIRDESIAAVLAEKHENGSRVTVIQRNSR